MALHGEVKVNHNEIATWEAVQIGLVEGSNPKYKKYCYRCHVEYRDIRGYLRKTGPFLIHHYYDDNALILASKVLDQAAVLFRKIDEESHGH